ncbi:MAG: hypothetical protein JXR96_12890 [Deltaproteobacteria bacterium]|nr:hypothetical protein [Deltaproteobacteria bacterium]
MSLRIKYLLATALSVLLPLAVYLIVDALLTRSFLIREQAGSLRLVADLVDGAMRGKRPEAEIQQVLTRFASAHPGIEVLVLDEQSKVVATTRPGLRGQSWREEGIARVLRGERDFDWATMEHQGQSVLDVTVPWRGIDGRILGAIHLDRKLSEVQEQITNVQIRHLIFVVAVALLVGVFLSLMTYSLVIKRLGRLDRQLHSADWAARSPELAVRGDEIEHASAAIRSLVGHLASTAAELERALQDKDRLIERVERFNVDLASEVQRSREELLAAQEELLRAEHLSTIGQLSAGLAHEIRNPLFIIRASAESLVRKAPAAEQVARDVIEEVDRVDAIISELLELGRPLSLDQSTVDLEQVLQAVVAQVSRAQPACRPVEWKLECQGDCRCCGDFSLLRQAFSQLVANACEAIEARGTIWLQASPDGQGHLQLEIRDDGAGIAPEDLEHVFEPFFTRKAHGTGLGLAASEKILTLHGASIAIESQPGQGTAVRVRIPAACRAEEEA